MSSYLHDLIRIERLEVNGIRVCSFWGIVYINFAVPTPFRVVGFKNGLAPTVENRHMKTIWIKTRCKDGCKQIIECIAIWGKSIWNVINNAKYIKALQENRVPMEIETLSKTDKYNEYVMTGLRTIWGVSIEKVERDFGLNYKNYLLEQATIHLKNDLLYLDDDKLLVTKKGKFLSDGIASDLFKINI